MPPRKRAVVKPKTVMPTMLLQHAAPPIPQPGVWCHEHGIWECSMITGIDIQDPSKHNPKACHAFPAPGSDVCVEHKDTPQPVRRGFFGG